MSSFSDEFTVGTLEPAEKAHTYFRERREEKRGPIHDQELFSLSVAAVRAASYRFNTLSEWLNRRITTEDV